LEYQHPENKLAIFNLMEGNIMNTPNLIDKELLALLKSDYFLALATYRDSLNEKDLSKLRNSENTYKSFYERELFRST
jgi:hypothetical protein